MFFFSKHKDSVNQLIPFVLPVIFFLITVWSRQMYGPYWLDINLDPTYGYLLNSLNILNNTPPTHIDHPGTTVQFFGAIIFWFMYLGSETNVIIDNVLGDPEYHLRAINYVVNFIHAILILTIGLLACGVFKNFITPVILQLSPLFSHLIIRHGTHLKPETLLITTSLLIIILTLYVLKTGVTEKNSNKVACFYGVVGSFGVATKVTFFPLLIVPVFLFTKKINFLFYGLTVLFSFLFFTSAIFDVYDQFFEYMKILFWGSESYGSGLKTIINIYEYPDNLYDLLSRPMLCIPIALSLFSLHKFNFLFSKLQKGSVLSSERKYLKILKGITLGQIFSILLIAKNPSSLYLIPVLMLSAIVIAINFELWIKNSNHTLRKKIIKTTIMLIGIGLILQMSSVYRSAKEHSSYHQDSIKVNNNEFDQCARIYFPWASSKSFALYWGNNLAGQSFNKELRSIIPENDFWFSVHGVREGEVRDFLLRISKPGIRNMDGPIDYEDILENYSCLYFRGTDQGQFYKFLPTELLNARNVNSTCSGLKEHILTDLKICEE